MADSTTSLTLNGLLAGVNLSTSGSIGTFATGSSTGGQSGYGLATATDKDGKTYQVITLANSATSGINAPTLTIDSAYSQADETGELDLEVRYAGIPSGTSIQVICDKQSVLSIGKQSISGSGLVSSMGNNLGQIDTGIQLLLWISDMSGITSTSTLTLNLSQVQGSGGGPVKKTILEKFQLNLSN